MEKEEHIAKEGHGKKEAERCGNKFCLAEEKQQQFMEHGVLILASSHANETRVSRFFISTTKANTGEISPKSMVKNFHYHTFLITLPNSFLPFKFSLFCAICGRTLHLRRLPSAVPPNSLLARHCGLFTCLSCTSCSCVSSHRLPDMSARKRVCVVVLGDIGRSPRMQYHVKSLLEHNFAVDLVGYLDTTPIAAIATSEQVKIHELNPFPNLELPRLINYVTKTIWQFLTLLVALLSISRPHLMLCQNPPAIPTLVVCYYYCWVRNTRLLVDWHNYTHSILALTSAETSLLVRLARWIEGYYGRRSAGNLCVTEAMKRNLLEVWDIKATVLYDRPPEHFRPITLEEKHELFVRLSETIPQFLTRSPDDFKESGVLESTNFTQKLSSGAILVKPNRPGIVISSTSWTPDEDFGVLLQALQLYEDHAAQQPDIFPDLVCVITGKGPQKEHYMTLLGEKRWRHVSVSAPWLENQDYPRLLAAADLGVCLHWSSSGLDLPMKVVDMFGCGLPVCAINFKCLDELLQHRKNGFVFDTPQQLFQHLCYWFERFPDNIALTPVKDEMERHLRTFQRLRWQDNWDREALTYFQ
ncbi:chitobiosyldiphosphodolichol beta-mannosyltransferase [Phlebotomus argentipes]|uniref:chitobiosyldiphosphodolichol beta-mannosyltransferase n=1 Tax=Phlebotomus argentipes TaxID=94469 RepID=UPI0028933448|nr:chitobiosyldiphosphodolichol beta-mannosyltransferase [Phlebotomus argentipes]